MGNDGLLERLERRMPVLPHWNGRNHRTDIRRGDHGMHAGTRQRGALVDGADAPVREGAAQNHGMQHVREGEVINVFSAPAEKPGILDAFDRASDQCVPRAGAIHAKSRSLRLR